MTFNKHNPPASVAVTVAQWAHDVNGNPIAHYRLAWPGGGFNSARREQVGYSDKATGGARARLESMFPGTVWTVDPAGIEGDRAAGRATFNLVRDYDRESVPVLFRAERGGDYRDQVTAVFPTVPGTGPDDVTVYAHIGQHGSGSRGWYQTTRKATPAEYEGLRRELEARGYRLEIRARWTSDHDRARRVSYDAHRLPQPMESI